MQRLNLKNLQALEMFNYYVALKKYHVQEIYKIIEKELISKITSDVTHPLHNYEFELICFFQDFTQNFMTMNLGNEKFPLSWLVQDQSNLKEVVAELILCFIDFAVASFNLSASIPVSESRFNKLKAYYCQEENLIPVVSILSEIIETYYQGKNLKVLKINETYLAAQPNESSQDKKQVH